MLTRGRSRRRKGGFVDTVTALGLGRVRHSDAARDGDVAERALLERVGARGADDAVVAREEEDGARQVHAHDALVPGLRLVALVLDPGEHVLLGLLALEAGRGRCRVGVLARALWRPRASPRRSQR